MEIFYCDILGCAVEREQKDLGLLQLRAGTSLIDLVPVAGQLGRMGGKGPGQEGRNLDHFCLQLKNFDVEVVMDYLKQAGLIPDKPSLRYGAGGAGLSIYIEDPEGNVVELRAAP